MDLNTLLFTVIKMYEKDDTTIEYRLSLVYIISFSSSSFNVSPDLVFHSVLPFLLIPSTNISANDELLNSYLYYTIFHSSIWRVFIQVFDGFSFKYLTVQLYIFLHLLSLPKIIHKKAPTTVDACIRLILFSSDLWYYSIYLF